MAAPFRWYVCRYLLRVICIDRSFSDLTANIFHKCRDCSYKPARPGFMCEKEDCKNPRRKHGIPKTTHRYYS